MTKKVLHVDDHELTRAGCALVLASQDRYELVHALGKGRDVLPWLKDHDVDVILLDIILEDMSGLSLLAELAAIPDTRVIILTGQNDARQFRFALDMGASGIVQKSDPGDEILAALNAIDGETPYLSPSIASQLQRLGAPPVQLSPRQAAILHYMANGETNKEIGAKLGIAMPTVSFHIAEMRRKLGVSHNRKIVQAAKEIGLI
ncbi:two component transcriptional regulator, LuxR family [Parasphingorhabdus marina DSM 22363]|uniref:Two component transcriptional regulator, LuxR family n=1 Tax=Parasphingorhabdus marina DSM 22363 TaxID=1123272 RepID=A0A1N6HU20_9SPHN|nr:response regulator transcription factor [Parasphingorhabdus marina]SIO23358.1 two component transcriptional regulator, LuxR family [Parasphingorhabdus marina DSM 22363]